jgi:hypothetical protein
MRSEAGETERLPLYSLKAGLSPPSSDLSKGNQIFRQVCAGSMGDEVAQPKPELIRKSDPGKFLPEFVRFARVA